MRVYSELRLKVTVGVLDGATAFIDIFDHTAPAVFPCTALLLEFVARQRSAISCLYLA
jgi:hypothetical protein